MKKAVMVAALIMSAMVTFAQDAYKVAIHYIPEKIEILPGVYELMGTVIDGSDAGKDSYALSVNENLVSQVTDSLNRHVSQVLYGPRLEKLVQKKIIEDYRQKRLELEKDLQMQIAEADSSDKKSLRQELAAEKKMTKYAMGRLKEIVARYNVRAIYVYGRGNASVSPPNPSVTNPPVTSKPSRDFSQPDE